MAIKTNKENNDYKLTVLVRNPRVSELVPDYADTVDVEEEYTKFTGYDTDDNRFEVFIKTVEVLGLSFQEVVR
jgi:hypothetical protein